MIARDECERVFRAAVDACDPERLVRDTLAELRMARMVAGRARIGVAMGKAALGMARGCGAVTRGVAVSNADDGDDLPPGWTKMIAGHPEPDVRSLEAGDAVIDAVASATRRDEIYALVSGGASALVERPVAGVTLDQLRAEVAAVMASGAPIADINRRRRALSAIKGGKLARMSEAPIVTLLVSDLIGDDPAVIGSGPTYVGEPAAGLRATPAGEIVIAPMRSFFERVRERLTGAWWFEPSAMTESVEACAVHLVRDLEAPRGVVGWGEPTILVPDQHGEGGRAQQLALILARRLANTDRAAFVAGSDGIDGPAPRDRPAPAGAYIDGKTWAAIRAAGIDPDRALSRCDAGTALAAVGALFVPGPTGINHGDIAIVG